MSTVPLTLIYFRVSPIFLCLRLTFGVIGQKGVSNREAILSESSLPLSASGLPPQQIWQVVTDLKHWQWRSDLSACTIVDEQRFIEIPKKGKSIHFCTTRREEPRIWEFQMDSPTLTGTWHGTFAPKENGRSQVTFVEAVQLRHKLFPSWIVKRFLRAYQARYFRDLRAELQSRYG